MLTKEEEILLRKLSKSPKCMHDPILAIERENHWQCGQCGLIAKKTVWIDLPELPK
jgi:ribosomal protein S27AE